MCAPYVLRVCVTVWVYCLLLTYNNRVPFVCSNVVPPLVRASARAARGGEIRVAYKYTAHIAHRRCSNIQKPTSKNVQSKDANVTALLVCAPQL